MRAVILRLLGLLAVGVLTAYGFRSAPVTVGLVDDQLRFVMPWLREAWVSLACIAVASALATLLVSQPIFAKVYARKRLKIIFPNKANLDSKHSLFRQSHTYFSQPPHPEAARRISTHKIYIGVENVAGNFTARNARLNAVCIFPPGWVVDIPFAAARTGVSKIDIQPGDVELFLVLVGNDDNRFTATPKILDADHFKLLLTEFDKKPERARLASVRGTSPGNLLPNDGYVVELRAYADDARPAEAIALINTRNRIEMFVYRSRLHMRVSQCVGSTRDIGGKLLCRARNLLPSQKPQSSDV